MFQSIKVVMVAASIVALSGCQRPESGARLHGYPQGDSGETHTMADHFSAMADNARRYELRITAYHFASHSAALNETGRQALRSFGDYLEANGTPVYFASENARTTSLYDARVASIRTFLTEDLGLDEALVVVSDAYPSGRRIDAADGIALLQAARAGLVAGPATGGL